ncbi:hypothetical protein C0989_010728 [Termitomyces sp. Mn162]|nr:hypothetical protein C0989_010728 [Termitomyces sp. Mn162]
MSFPNDSWSIDGEESGDPVLVFTRQPTAKEFEEFVAKSQKISHLTLPQRIIPWNGQAARKAEFIRVAPEVYETLHLTALAAGHVLFPNLVSMVVLDPCPELEPLYDIAGSFTAPEPGHSICEDWTCTSGHFGSHDSRTSSTPTSYNAISLDHPKSPTSRRPKDP